MCIYIERFKAGKRAGKLGVNAVGQNAGNARAESYDFNMGKLSQFKSDSHEIMLSYVFLYIVEALSPRYF